MIYNGRRRVRFWWLHIWIVIGTSINLTHWNLVSRVALLICSADLARLVYYWFFFFCCFWDLSTFCLSLVVLMNFCLWYLIEEHMNASLNSYFMILFSTLSFFLTLKFDYPDTSPYLAFDCRAENNWRINCWLCPGIQA